MKILILGGYGVFGGRLAQLLDDIADLEMIIAGRNYNNAVQFCNKLSGKSTVNPLKLDRNDIKAALREEKPDLLIDASGPFQDYSDGSGGYDTIISCIDCGVNYLDFADAADFVFGASQFDASAKVKGVFVLSGVSSFPVLTAAVLREISKSMDIVSVSGGIAPSPYAGIGLNVMRAVVGYAGAPVKLLRKGMQGYGTGLAESMRYTIAVPGYLPLKNIHFSLVDVPDLQVIPPEHSGLQDIWMGAGPVPELLHKILNLLAKTRAFLKLPSFAPLSPLFYTVLNLLKFGEHRGGMFVHVQGERDSKNVEMSWHLLAEGDDGPYIPSMAIEAIIRKILNGDVPEIGARPATRALELSDYKSLFANRNIHMGFREAGVTSNLYEEILGNSFTNLPKQVQELHKGSGKSCWQGEASVQRGKSWLAKLVCLIIGFPKTSEKTSIKVSFDRDSSGEKWTRDFGGKCFSSIQLRGDGRNNHLIVEKFGPVRASLALVAKQDKLFLISRRWSFMGIPMPSALMPRGESFETVKNGLFNFNVEIKLPFIGLIVAYQGTLAPENK